MFHGQSYLAPWSHVFCVFSSILLSNVITSLGEERTDQYASREFVCLSCMHNFFVFSSSSWCQGLASACAYGTPSTFPVTSCVDMHVQP